MCACILRPCWVSVAADTLRLSSTRGHCNRRRRWLAQSLGLSESLRCIDPRGTYEIVTIIIIGARASGDARIPYAVREARRVVWMLIVPAMWVFSFHTTLSMSLKYSQRRTDDRIPVRRRRQGWSGVVCQFLGATVDLDSDWTCPEGVGVCTTAALVGRRPL